MLFLGKRIKIISGLTIIIIFSLLLINLSKINDWIALKNTYGNHKKEYDLLLDTIMMNCEGNILIDVLIADDSASYPFILDTGAGLSYISPFILQKCNLQL